MTQKYLGQITDTTQESGDDLAARLNAFDSAHKTNQSGTTRPGGIQPGGIWSKDMGSSVYALMIYDGSGDRPVRPTISGGDGITVTNPGGEPTVAVNGTVARRNTDNQFASGQTIHESVKVTPGGNGNAHYWFRTAADDEIGLVYIHEQNRVLTLRVQPPSGGSHVHAMLFPNGIFQAQAFSGDGSRLTGLPAIGVGQTWRDMTSSRNPGTTYQNTTGQPIEIVIFGRSSSSSSSYLRASSNGSSWTRISDFPATSAYASSLAAIIPAGWYYRVDGGLVAMSWAELR